MTSPRSDRPAYGTPTIEQERAEDARKLREAAAELHEAALAVLDADGTSDVPAIMHALDEATDKLGRLL